MKLLDVQCKLTVDLVNVSGPWSAIPNGHLSSRRDIGWVRIIDID